MSPYFNSNSILVKFYDEILLNESDISSGNLSEKDIYEKVFKKEKFSYSSMRNQMSSLYKLCGEFLLVHSTLNDSENRIDNDIKMLGQYSRRFLDNNFKLLHKKIEDKINYKLLGEKYFEIKLKLEQSISSFEYLRNNSDKRRESLYNSTLNRLCTVVSNLSENISVINYNENIFNQKLKVNPSRSLINNLNIEKFLSEIQSVDEINYNFINQEFRFIRLILNPEDFDNYYQLKKDIFKNINEYSNSEKYYHTNRLLTFLVNNFQLNNFSNVAELSNFRKFQLKNIDYGNDGVESLTIRIFIDILNSFIITESDITIDDFINENLEKVESINRENACNYAFARLEVKRKNFEKALEYLAKLKLTEVNFKLYSKLLFIQIYYELESFDSGLNAIDTLKHFLKSSKTLTTPMKKRYKVLLKIIEKIYKIRLKPENFTLLDLEILLKENIDNSYDNFNWYHQKIENLMSFYSKKGKFKKIA